MDCVRMTAEQMEGQVARFSQLRRVEFTREESSAPEPDLPMEARELVEFGHSRYLLSVIGLEGGAGTQITSNSPINGAGGMTMTYAVCPPGTGPALHTHVETYETFTVLQGRFELTYNDDGSGELILEKFDVVCVPPRVIRTFRNISDEDGILQVIITGGVHDRADLDFARVVGEKLTEFDSGAVPYFEGLGFKFSAQDA